MVYVGIVKKEMFIYLKVDFVDDYDLIIRLWYKFVVEILD